jgi:3-phosphoshikimate 1-carboxyvinyltransferase
MIKTIQPFKVNGSVSAIAAKSQVHRLLICAALANESTKIYLNTSSEDIDATASSITALGAKVFHGGNFLLVSPIEPSNRGERSPSLIDCGESGSTLRFLLPVAAALGKNCVFTGHGRLPLRPHTPLLDALKSGGVRIGGDFPITVNQKLQNGVFELPGNVSSQYFSGLLMALPLLNGSSKIIANGKLESAGYIEATLEVMAQFGVFAKKTAHGFEIEGGQSYKTPGKTTAEGDWSNAAFWLCAGALGGNITVSGLRENSLQGDREIIDVLKNFGASVKITEDNFFVSGGKLKAITVNAENIPDIVPIIACVASVADGQTVIEGAARLRIKESDRLKTTAGLINDLGGNCVETPDGLVITGKPGGLNGGIANGAGDHRLVMCAAILASVCRQSVTVLGAEAVNKSYPGFFNDLENVRAK